jgi:hypothetical protein
MTPRPKITDDVIIEAAAKRLLKPVTEWLAEAGDEDESNTLEELKAAIKFESDGYDIAKYLDRKGWMPNARLVEILDQAFSAKHSALAEACKAWVIATGAKEIPLETVVLWKKDSWPEPKEGIVTRNSDEGKSTVTFESYGQKRGSGYVIPWEELTVKG